MSALACASVSRVAIAPVPTERVDQASGLNLKLSNSVVVNGGFIRMTLESIRPQWGELRGRVNSKEATEFPVYLLKKAKAEALFGIHYSVEPGQVIVEIFSVKEPSNVLASIPVQVVDGKYQVESLKVDPDKVNPPPAAVIRIHKESARIGALYNIVTPKKYWASPIQKPIESTYTSLFGGKRMYNGEMKSYHSGLDFRAPVGTPIRAPLAGRVVLVEKHYMSGGLVILDHGYGFYSSYLHMSKFLVKKGHVVKAGQTLGLSGDTGRVSGPHLHWVTTLNKVKVDPEQVLEALK